MIRFRSIIGLSSRTGTSKICPAFHPQLWPIRGEGASQRIPSDYCTIHIIMKIGMVAPPPRTEKKTPRKVGDEKREKKIKIRAQKAKRSQPHGIGKEKV